VRTDNLKDAFNTARGVGSVRLFSMRARVSGRVGQVSESDGRLPISGFELKLNLRDEHYPFWSKGRLNKVKRVDILARSTATPVPGRMDIFQSAGPDNTRKGVW
jgi:hypothetical protein